ncbi:MAG: exosome complex RNA-binding protein Csl4 [Candidatus Bathyarchaeota archaeon]
MKEWKMPSSKQKTGQFVVPGDRLGVIEEFMPGPGTYEENGTIYSSATGRALIDVLNKQVSVFPRTRFLPFPQVGSLITGQVTDVQSKTAVVRIYQVSKHSLSGFFTGILHVSDVSLRYVETMYEVCKPGDLIRAKVVSDKNRTFHLSTKEPDLGVIHAFCSHCGNILTHRKVRMHCSKCGKIENRKAAQDYGKGEMA